MALDGAPTLRLDEATIQRDKLATLGQLTAGIAHDLNNPIGYVSSNVAALGRAAADLSALVRLADGLIPPEMRVRWQQALKDHSWQFHQEDIPGLVEDTQGGAELLKGVVADLKSLSRSSAAVETVALDDCVRATLNVMRYHVRHGIDLELHLGAARPLEMVRAQVIQVLTNLIHNALQAMDGRGRLRLTTSDDGVEAVVCLEDSGPGVPTDLRERIFEPFFTTKQPGFGTGLGLPIVRRIAEHHGGTATCGTSADLGGAAFRISLRRAETA